MLRALFHFPRLLVLLSTSLAMLAIPTRADENRLTVFAAASLTNAVGGAAKRFEQQTGIAIRLSFAGSSTLARQIEAGADADLFLSANEAWADYLLDRGLLDPQHQTRSLSNDLVLVGPIGKGQKSLPHLSEKHLFSRLGKDGLIAMGDPDHVPAGIYGKQALEALGLWQATSRRIARTDNVRAAVALVSRREVPLAIVYKSDMVGIEDLQILYVFERTGPPIRYVFAKTTNSQSTAAEQLLSFLTGTEGMAIFQRYGFSTATEK